MSPGLDLVLHGAAVPTWLIDRTRLLTGAVSVQARPPQAVRLHGAAPHPEVPALCAAERLDFAYVPGGRQLADYGLLAMDMDSTLISIESIDELADYAGCKPQVAAITERAMRGEIDYAASLRQRVALLAGLPERTLQRVYEERLRLSAGVRELLAAARQAGLATMLVSGGFTYFARRLQDELGLDHAFANELEMVDGHLTGQVVGDIVDAAGKARLVAAVRQSLGLSSDRVITIGDGANDLPMFAESGLAVAFHAKPLVRTAAAVALDFTGLDGLLTVLGA